VSTVAGIGCGFAQSSNRVLVVVTMQAKVSRAGGAG